MSTPDQQNKTKEEAIQTVIRQQDQTLRKKYPFFQYQTSIGTSLWLGSMALVVANAWAYVHGFLPWYVALPFAAFPLSILHELEHDLIHKQYFPGNKFMRDTMLGFIWIFKCGQELSPYVRRDIHLHHHQQSGQIDDIEERLIGLGVRSNVFRLAAAFAPALGLVYVHAPGWGIEATTSWRVLRGKTWYSPERIFFLFEAFLVALPMILVAAAFMGIPYTASLLVVWAGPNILRHACLVVMSSYSHYYLADEPNTVGDITLQNQVLNHWSLLPFQLFCFNFGAEHIIHHYVISQPFYLRHLCRYKAWEIMKASGVPINDFGIFWRGNRHALKEKST